jgi:hypothetical protein
MGTQEVHWKGVCPWLVRWARHAGTRDFCPALSALDRPSPKMFSLSHLICPHRLASWAGSPAAPPVSKYICVSKSFTGLIGVSCSLVWEMHPLQD